MYFCFFCNFVILVDIVLKISAMLTYEFSTMVTALCTSRLCWAGLVTLYHLGIQPAAHANLVWLVGAVSMGSCQSPLNSDFGSAVYPISRILAYCLWRLKLKLYQTETSKPCPVAVNWVCCLVHVGCMWCWVPQNWRWILTQKALLLCRTFLLYQLFDSVNVLL